MNKKSDVVAKKKYAELLREKGVQNVRITSSPTDIRAEKDGYDYFFEIKMTHQSKKYFGAATLTEWEQAVSDPNHFLFVVAMQNDDNDTIKFIEFTPEEFMQFSSIPPFKIFFNID